MTYKTHIDDGDWSGAGGNGAPQLRGMTRSRRPAVARPLGPASSPALKSDPYSPTTLPSPLRAVAAALEKVAMNVAISNASPAALAQALTTIRTRPGRVWALPKARRRRRRCALVPGVTPACPMSLALAAT